MRAACLLLLAAAGLAGAGAVAGTAAMPGGSPAATPGAPPAATAAAAPAATAGPPSRPSLLLVTFDTTRADRIGCYGAKDAATPTLDALAKRGVRFAEALSPAPLTLPSHATIMTGLSPREHGARDNEGYRLDEGQVTLAERLQAAGYTTAAFVGAAVLDRVTGIGQGFATFDDQVRVGPERWFAWQERAAQQVVDAVEAKLSSLTPPFFLWVHLYDPHIPYVPPEPYATRFAKRPYEGEIAYADAQLGRLLKLLAARGLDRALIVAVAGDHGESLGEHGELTHDVFVYQATQRVPLILAGPGIATGRVIEPRIGLVDLAPTLADLLGVPFPEARGRSQAPWLRPAAPPARPAEPPSYEIESVFPARAYGWAPLFGSVQGTLKFIDAPQPELYDLARDPQETTNLLAATPRDDDARRALEAGRPLAAKVRALFAADIEALSAGGDAAGTATVDPEHRARLEALGYAGGSASRPGDPRIDPKYGMTFIGDLDRARERLQRGDPKEAALLATRLLSRNPQNLPARLVLAQAQLGQGDATAALATLDEAIARAPDDPLPRFQRGNALRLAGRTDPAALDAAAAAYREALARHPRHAPSVYALASLLVERGDLAGASALLDDAERRGVADGALLTLRGAAEAARGRGDAADAALARALALDPSSATALEGRGKLAYARGDARAAAGFYRQALALAPSAALARTLGAILWFDLSDAAGARAALQQALALDPTGPDADDVRALLAEIR